ncbi:MAG TPA: response regulator [Chroococcidiopsis sp.]
MGAPREAIASPQSLSDQEPLLLLAGDNRALSISISSYVKAKGYSLLVASSGLEAITLAQLHRPQVLLVDSDLLQEEQHNILQHIRQGPGNPWMILLTGANSTTDCDRHFSADCDRVMTKPVNLKQLLATVQELLANHPSNS